jgi:hypothetical protein
MSWQNNAFGLFGFYVVGSGEQYAAAARKRKRNRNSALSALALIHALSAAAD